jgi:hypothetical protein
MHSTSINLVGRKTRWLATRGVIGPTLLRLLPTPQGGPETGQLAGITHYNLDSEKVALKGYDPVGYLPAYGGWCATARARSGKVQIDPVSFKVTNGRLFLFYNGLFGNAIKDGTRTNRL